MSTKLAPVDENVRLPKAVRDAAEKASSFYKKVDEPAPADSQPQAEAAPAAPQPQAEAAPPAASEPAPQPQAPPPAPPPPAPNVDYEHLYKSWKGRYDAEIPRLRGQVASLEAAIQEQQQRRVPEPSETSVERFVTDKDVEDYGPDLLEVVGKRAKEEFNPLVSKLQRRIDQLESRLQGVGTEIVKTSRERLYAALDDQVPDWRVLDENPKFIEWLQLPDQYSGAIRHKLLSTAYERNDSPRVIAFFKGFLAEEAASAPATAEPDFNPRAKPAVEKVPLENFAAPGRAKSTAAQSAPVEKPYITRAQITQFYADSAAGRYQGREAEKDRLEQMIYEAQRDGRIR